MGWHLLLINNVDCIDAEYKSLADKCSQYFGIEAVIYRPLPFVDHTGFTETVEEEVDFVVGAQQSVEKAFLTAKEFAEEWKLTNFLNKRVVHLSGGWRKFLGVALFTNRRADVKMYFDVASHLADERLRLLLGQLSKQGVDQEVVFCEYDSHLIMNLARDRFSLLLDAGDRIEAVASFPQHTTLRQQSNYGIS